MGALVGEQLGDRHDERATGSRRCDDLDHRALGPALGTHDGPGERSRRRVAAGGAQVHHHDRPADHRADRYDDREDVGSEGVVQAHERVAALDDLSNGGLQRPLSPSRLDRHALGEVAPFDGDDRPVAHDAQCGALEDLADQLVDQGLVGGPEAVLDHAGPVGLEIEGVDGRVAPHLFGLAREVLFGERLEPLEPPLPQPVGTPQRAGDVGSEGGQVLGLSHRRSAWAIDVPAGGPAVPV
jgi:hypothetical protein